MIDIEAKHEKGIQIRTYVFPCMYGQNRCKILVESAILDLDLVGSAIIDTKLVGIRNFGSVIGRIRNF